ncbi:DUF805 domain-containing protein [Streptomyces sp. NBC_01476]|uniref:DUF805 domain-containing protein n=1 Tax=Streptomyces sp. NBC_01476 TaxID=2903881 RepID=UPI002E35DEFE|nr:DUF805 domain-containing protein [Streptomyces sp. NBC_01476]
MRWYVDVFKKYAVFEGRARRREFWMYSLFDAVVLVLLFLIGLQTDIGAPFQIYVLATFVPRLAVLVRRLHDTGRSGWSLLIGIVPVVGIIVVLLFLSSGSFWATNQYGPNPKDVPVYG